MSINYLKVFVCILLLIQMYLKNKDKKIWDLSAVLLVCLM